MPWIYEKETPEVHFTSPYNRKPKGHKDEHNYEIRLANIRKALSTQDERYEKLRQDRLAAKPYVGYDRIIAGTIKAMNQAEMETKKGKGGTAAQKAAEIAAAKELGIKVGPAKRGSKSGITSKGGSLGKKEREVLQLAKGSLGYEVGSAVSSSDAKKEGNK